MLTVKMVDNVEIQAVHRASYHCGEVVLEINLPDGLVDVRRCDCSLCRRRGAIVASVSLEAISIVKGQAYLRQYQFNTMTAKHYFVNANVKLTH